MAVSLKDTNKQKYPPPVDPNNCNSKGCYGWMNFKMNLGRAAIMVGNPSMSTGGKVNKVGRVVEIFKCSSCYHNPRSSQQEVTENNTYHKTTLINNK